MSKKRKTTTVACHPKWGKKLRELSKETKISSVDLANSIFEEFFKRQPKVRKEITFDYDRV